MKFLSIYLVVLGFILTSARAENPIDFSNSDNLKAVYDAGFRPWRNGPDSCHLDHVNVTIILPEGVQFSLPVEMVDFSVLAENKLSSANFVGEVMSTDETIVKLREICNALNLPTNSLDQFAATFADRAAKSVIWNTRGQKGEISVFVSTDRLDFIDHLGAEIYVTLQWKRKGAPMKFLTSPVQPPPGYEHESMAPPGVKPGQKGFPAHDMQYYKDLIAKKKAEEANPAAPVAPPPVSVVLSVEEKETSPWSIILLLLAAAAAVFAWIKYRRK